MNTLPCVWCGARDWTAHCDDGRCRWCRCRHCDSLLDVQAMILLPPTSTGHGPMPAE